MLASLQEILQQNFHKHFSLEQRRNNLYQVFVPIFYPDGDMMDIFIRVNDDGSIILCDCGLSLMRLSYTMDTISAHRSKLLNDIIKSFGAYDNDGEICLTTTKEMLFNNIMQFSQVVNKVVSMELLKTENVDNLFYENAREYICKTFGDTYKLEHNFVPCKESPELVVDYAISGSNATKPIYLFAAQGSTKALNSVIAILKLQKLGKDFFSVVLHNDYSKLSKKDQKNVMSVADKLFYDLPSFMDAGPKYVQQTIH